MFDSFRTPAPSLDEAPSPDESHDLVLFMYTGCGYSHRVMYHAEALGIELPVRDIHADPQALALLLETTGRRTVPLLLIDGQPLAESRVIMAWLDRYAQRAA